MIHFEPHPEIARKKSEFNPAVHRTWYKYDYEQVFREIASQPAERHDLFAKSMMRHLIKDDLFFIVFFVMEIPPANHPFVVQMCHDIEAGSKDGGISRTGTLDIYAREHFKSTVITMGLTIKRIVNNPECCTAIFSFKKGAADKFLSGIRETLEKPLMLQCFPDVLFEKPDTQSPSWSILNGIRVKRNSASRKEHTVESFGLVEGMPTGGHYDHRIYDDVETDDVAENPEQMDKCFSKFEMSDNLGTNGGTEMIVGTFYSHFGPLVRIKEKLDIHGKPMYQTILKPATHDGKPTGKPVLLTQERLDKLRVSAHFNSQQLCDPTPPSDIRLNPGYLKPIEPEFIPRDVVKFMVLDQAGGDDTNKEKGDLWALGLFGVKPKMDEVGASEVYLMDLEADRMTHSEGIEMCVRMYLNAGIVRQFGVEKVGLATTEVHICNALRAHGRRLSVESGNLVLLRPGMRSLQKRIESMVQWPLCNGKIHYSTAINHRKIDRLKLEMEKFPYFHSDILNIIAYLYDMTKAYRFAGSGKMRAINYEGVFLR